MGDGGECTCGDTAAAVGAVHEPYPLVGAVRRLDEEVSKGSAYSYAATAFAGFAEDTQELYLQELRKFAWFARLRLGETNREALSAYMLHLVRTTSNDGGLKKILAGVRFLEKLQWVSAIITQADWALVNAAEKYHERWGTQVAKLWGTMEMF